jgi:hypothetical protein
MYICIRVDLAEALGRKSMKNEDLAHESYLSISPQGIKELMILSTSA